MRYALLNPILEELAREGRIKKTTVSMEIDNPNSEIGLESKASTSRSSGNN